MFHGVFCKTTIIRQLRKLNEAKIEKIQSKKPLGFCRNLHVWLYIYIYISPSTERQFRWITILHCGEKRQMLQPEIDTRLNLRQSDILSNCHRWRDFLRINFYICVIGYMKRSILAKSYCISAYVVPSKYSYKSSQPAGWWCIYCHIYSLPATFLIKIIAPNNYSLYR